MTDLRAVLGTDVSIVWEVVKSVSFSRRGARLSDGSRPTRGPKLKKSDKILRDRSIH